VEFINQGEKNITEPTLQQRMLHGPAAPDFLEPRHEWGAFFQKPGTFLLVVVAAGAGVVVAQSGGAITFSMKVVAPGLMVMAIIYFMGAVGGTMEGQELCILYLLTCNSCASGA
jgi:aquaporin Z